MALVAAAPEQANDGGGKGRALKDALRPLPRPQRQGQDRVRRRHACRDRVAAAGREARRRGGADLRSNRPRSHDRRWRCSTSSLATGSRWCAAGPSW